MAKQNILLVNTDGPENRVALVEGGNLAELFIERQKSVSNVGNIYKGKVLRVMPGMQAAFVDIGLEKAAFLYITDIVGGRLPNRIKLYLQNQDEEDDVEEDEELDFDILEEDFDQQKTPRIEQLLSPGQEILVQVAKDPLGTKGSRVTGYVTLPGRHLVFMPYVDHVGISRKIEDDEERLRLEGILEEIRPINTGFIIRTACVGQNAESIRNDLDYLLLMWERIQSQYHSVPAPSLIFSELDLILRCIRDLVTPEIDKCMVDSPIHYKRIKEFMEVFLPQSVHILDDYRGNIAIFDLYDLEPQIDQALTHKVWLKSGGYLVFERTEALTTIDVNTGSFIGQRSLEETITQINMEAAKEIPLQLRLRNIGGLIVIDFIDMENEENRERVMQAFAEALSLDRARHMVLPISEFGLMQITRQRIRESLLNTMTEPCSYCRGKGYNKSLETISSEIIRTLIRKGEKIPTDSLRIKCNPTLADFLAHNYQDWLDRIELRLDKPINVHASEILHVEEYEITGEGPPTA
ncbi:Rne/Rng family ribonuclease [Myxococcota bacterium]|nr:Rne/Rng family ribonuclease [Myxococcota bacterium]MBU1536232.1 Rne/Rng family ribonuclease [Myxococcota bacterium]